MLSRSWRTSGLIRSRILCYVRSVLERCAMTQKPSGKTVRVRDISTPKAAQDALRDLLKSEVCEAIVVEASGVLMTIQHIDL